MPRRPARDLQKGHPVESREKPVCARCSSLRLNCEWGVPVKRGRSTQIRHLEDWHRIERIKGKSVGCPGDRRGTCKKGIRLKADKGSSLRLNCEWGVPVKRGRSTQIRHLEPAPETSEQTLTSREGHMGVGIGTGLNVSKGRASDAQETGEGHEEMEVEQLMVRLS
jgi:predicted small metal-binding protein